MSDLAAFLFGFMGSLHCVGMCGPLVLLYAAPSSRSGVPWRSLAAMFSSKHLLFNAGRAVSYANLGLFFGLVGWLLEVRLGLAGYIGLAAGVFVVLMGAHLYDLRKIG